MLTRFERKLNGVGREGRERGAAERGERVESGSQKREGERGERESG